MQFFLSSFFYLLVPFNEICHREITELQNFVRSLYTFLLSACHDNIFYLNVIAKKKKEKKKENVVFHECMIFVIYW